MANLINGRQITTDEHSTIKNIDNDYGIECFIIVYKIICNNKLTTLMEGADLL